MQSLSIIDLLSAASARAAIELPALELPAAEKSDPVRFPIAVSVETKQFLECQARVLGCSLSGLIGAILNEVVVQTKFRSVKN